MADAILKLSRTLVNTEHHQDFFSDQLHYQVTFTVLIIAALASTSLQFYAEPIQCVQPAQFTDAYTSFARTLCWLNNTYFYPQGPTRLPIKYEERAERTLRYYQWLPAVYLVQAILFMIPHLIWVSFYDRNGLHPGTMVKQGAKFDDKPEISKFLAKEIERYLMCRRLAQCKKKLYLKHAVEESLDEPTTPSSFLLPHVSFRTRSYSSYLVILYLFVKLIYILNIILQVLILNRILSTGNYGFIRFGFDTLRYIFRTSFIPRLGVLTSNNQQLFPFLTLCDFHIRELGQDHYYTIECILLINIFNEKIFFALWLWFGILFLISIGSFFYSIFIYWIFFSRRRFIDKLLRLVRSTRQHTITHPIPLPRTTSGTTTTVVIKRDEPDDSDIFADARRRRHFVEWLERDGVFLLHLLDTNGSEPLAIKCLEDLIGIWTKEYENETELARRLLKNQFELFQKR